MIMNRDSTAVQELPKVGASHSDLRTAMDDVSVLDAIDKLGEVAATRGALKLLKSLLSEDFDQHTHQKLESAYHKAVAKVVFIGNKDRVNLFPGMNPLIETACRGVAKIIGESRIAIVIAECVEDEDVMVASGLYQRVCELYISTIQVTQGGCGECNYKHFCAQHVKRIKNLLQR